MRTQIDTQTFRLSTTAPKSRALTADRLFWLMAALLVLILVLVILFPFRVPGDTPLYVDLGGRVLDGQRPYIDYFEINTPTIHFLNALPVAYSRLTGMHPVLAYDLLIWLFVAGAAVGVGIIMTRARQDQLLPNTQPWLIPALMVFASYLEWLLVNYGQRDHIFILALLTWSILRWYRWEGGQPPAWMAVPIGIFALVSAAFKPTFALAFALVEVYGLLRYRRWRSYFTWEVFSVSLMLGLYGLYFVLNPDVLRAYLNEIVPSVVDGYTGYGYIPAQILIFRDPLSVMVLSLALILAAVGLWQRSTVGKLRVLLALVALGSVLSYALQTKGWPYHALPVLFMLLVLAGQLTEATLMYRNIRWSRRSTSFAVIIVVFVCVATSFQFSTLYTFGHVRGVEHEPYLAFSTAGDTVVVADMDVRAAYSAIIQERLKPIGSYPIAYPLAFAYAAEDTIYAPDHVPPPIAQDYLDALMDDIQGKQPQLVLLRQGQSMNGPGFMNVARYVKARTDIETILERDYEYHGVFSDYEVYVHKTP